MNIIAATILLFVAKIASAGPNTAVETSAKSLPVPNMATIHREHVNHRMLEVSQQCLSDSDALYATQALSDATSAWDTELSENACNPDFSSTTIECSVDSTTFSSHASVVEACQQAGGTSILVNIDLDCDGTDYTFAIDMENFPTCFDASSCDVNNDGDLASLLGNQVEGLTQGLEECTTSVSEGSGSAKDAGPDGGEVTELPSNSPSAVYSSAPSSSMALSSAMPTISPSGAPSAAPSTGPTGGGGGTEIMSSAFHVNVKAISTLGVISAVVVAGVSVCV